MGTFPWPRTHAEAYRAAGIPCANWATSIDPRTDLPAVDGLDPQNYAWFSEGLIVRQLEVAGVTHAPTMYPADVHMENVAGEARTVRARKPGRPAVSSHQTS